MYAIRSYYENWHMFDSVTLAGFGPMKGEYYGLPWPCWTETHSGSPVLYSTDLSVAAGGMGFRNRFGLEHDGHDLLASQGSAPKKSKVNGGYAEITDKNIEELTGTKLTEDEKKLVEGKNWKTA